MVVSSIEMLSGRSKKEYAREEQGVADAPDDASTTPTNGATDEPQAIDPIYPHQLDELRGPP